MAKDEKLSKKNNKSIDKIKNEGLSKRNNIREMSERELLTKTNEKLDNLILAISVSGKSFQEQVNYLSNLGHKPQKISEIVGRSRQSVKDMVKALKGKKIDVKEDDVVLRLNALLRLITENNKDKQKYAKAIYYLKSVGISQIEIARIFGVKSNSIPSYIRRYHQMKNRKKSDETEQPENE